MKGSRPCIWVLVLLVFSGIIFMAGCSDNPEEPSNQAPDPPSNPTPVNLDVNIAQAGLELLWDCSDPENDTVYYDVYLGTDGNPSLLDSNIEQNHYYVEYLQADMTYYWRIIARDNKGNQSLSPIWSFSTGSALEFVYPIAIGYRWEYHRYTEFFNIDPPEIDSLITPWPDGTSQVTIDEMVDLNGITTYQFFQHFEQGDEIFEDNLYYSNQTWGLLFYGSDPAGTGIKDTPAPIRNPKKFIFHGKKYGSIEEILAEYATGTPGSMNKIGMVYASPLMVLYYPLQTGSQWNYIGNAGEMIWIDKKVLGTEEVQVPAGSFECYKIQWYYDDDKDGHWDDDISVVDYVSAAGLVKRVSVVKDIDVVTYSHPFGIGTMDISETIELSDYSLRRTE